VFSACTAENSLLPISAALRWCAAADRTVLTHNAPHEEREEIGKREEK
jgi:hypothetical protein